jgi:hypothetical protein
VRRNPNTHTYRYTCDYANCYPYTNANANFDSYSNGNRHRDTYTYGNFDSRSNIYNYAYGYRKCYSDGDGHTHVDAETVANGTTWTIDKAASHASAKAIRAERLRQNWCPLVSIRGYTHPSRLIAEVASALAPARRSRFNRSSLESCKAIPYTSLAPFT